MAQSAQLNFVRQQGFREANRAACDFQYPALMFQPRVVGILVVAGLISQYAPLFLILAAILWWNALVPARNPFDALYNKLVAGPKGLPQLAAAPAPRRFSQGMAGTFMLSIGVFLALGWQAAAWIVEFLLAVALSALVFGRFCLGSYIYHLVRGESSFANSTLPWAPGD